nr:agenet-like domain-containing protein [Tanacetum cinerariifolium]
MEVWYTLIDDAEAEYKMLSGGPSNGTTMKLERALKDEERILSTRVVDDDQLGIRHSGKIKIRLSRLPNKSDVSVADVGWIMDAWLHDGWCEGIVVHKESYAKIHGKTKISYGCKDLRYYEEWLGNE